MVYGNKKKVFLVTEDPYNIDPWGGGEFFPQKIRTFFSFRVTEPTES